MTKATRAQLVRAGRLLDFEGGATGNGDELAAAAARVYDKLHTGLAPLLGSAGVQALLARSARLARHDFASLSDVAILHSSTTLREHLAKLDPSVAIATATALFGTFFTLIATFIGERLTSQVLRSAWPTIEESSTGETKK